MSETSAKQKALARLHKNADKPDSGGAVSDFANTLEPRETEPYNAVLAMSGVRRVAFVPLDGLTEILPFSALVRLQLYDAGEPEILMIHTPLGRIEITGRNLVDVARHLQIEDAQEVRQFDPKRDEIPREKQAVVQSIRFRFEDETEKPVETVTEKETALETATN